MPIKTNLEMVRILKTWNGSINLDTVPFEEYRLREKEVSKLRTAWKIKLSWKTPHCRYISRPSL